MTPTSYVKAHWKTKTLYMMRDDSGYSYSTIRKTCVKLGIEPITEKDLWLSFILDNHGKLTQSEIANELKISQSTVCKICAEHHIECITAVQRREQEEARLMKEQQEKQEREKANIPRKSFWDRVKQNERREERKEMGNFGELKYTGED